MRAWISAVAAAAILTSCYRAPEIVPCTQPQPLPADELLEPLEFVAPSETTDIKRLPTDNCSLEGWFYPPEWDDYVSWFVVQGAARTEAQSAELVRREDLWRQTIDSCSNRLTGCAEALAEVDSTLPWWIIAASSAAVGVAGGLALGIFALGGI